MTNYVRFNTTIKGGYATVPSDTKIISMTECGAETHLQTSNGFFAVPGTREQVLPILKEAFNVDLADCQEVRFPCPFQDRA